MSSVTLIPECPSCSWTTLGCTPACNSERRHRVAQIVQADRWDAHAADRLLEHLQQPLRVVRLAGLVDEHVAGVGPRRSEREPLGSLMLAVRVEGGDGGWCEKKLALALGLRCHHHEYKWLENARTADRIPRPCNRRTCVRDTNFQMTLIADAIWFSRPQVLVTVTDLPDHWDRAHAAMLRLIRTATKAHVAECLYVVEHDQRLGSAHAHLLVKGELPPEESWHRAASRHAGPIIHIRPAEERHATYLFKRARFEGTACFRCATVALEQHIDLNGGRAEHHSNAFYADASGQPITLKDAVKLASERQRRSHDEWFPVDGGQWDY